MAGASFDIIDRFATRETSAFARQLLVQPTEIKASNRHKACLRAISSAAGLATAESSGAYGQPTTVESQLPTLLQTELTRVRSELLRSARTSLAPYLVFAQGGIRELLNKLLQDPSDVLPYRNARAGDRERHLLLYLQRIAAKNDTFSEFGPSGWGSVSNDIAGAELAINPGIAKRDCFLERWTAGAVAAALNRDPATRPELAPRLHPNGRIDNATFVFTDTNETISLDSETAEILAHCDGHTSAPSLSADLGRLEQLAKQNILRWEMEIPALEPHAFDVLISDISRWRDSSVRTQWLTLLRPIATLPEIFAHTTDVLARLELMDEAKRRLDDVGVAVKSVDRFLYTAANPICEDCSRDCGFIISKTMVEELTHDAEGWIDLWRDSYAFVASRVADGLRQLFHTMPSEGGAISLPAFLRQCELQKVPLTRQGLIALAHLAFAEVKKAFRDTVASRGEASEWLLTADDCHFVRQKFEYEKFDEYTFPSADLQISASSLAAVNDGNYEWILSELHPPIALLHHCMYWSCPDKPALSQALNATACGKPNFYYGFSAADFTAHTTVRQMDAMPELTNFVATSRAHPHWRVIPPAETEVFIDEGNGDVGLRRRGSHEYLGSFARYWIIPLGFHPFHFGRSPHMPRLRCGNVIVQRRSWTVVRDELRGGNFTGISAELVLAVERLRAERDLPRFVYIRPTEEALRRSGAEGRDKDTKPVFIDLESYLFLEIFHRWLTKAGELEVTEMLPDPDHLLWQEADGRRTFELRTLILPRE